MNRNELMRLLGYVEDLYHVSFPEERKRNIRRFSSHNSLTTTQRLTEKSVDAIIKDWKYWRRFLSRDSFFDFFEAELRSLLEIGCDATSSNPELRSFIGRKAQVVEPLPNVSLGTTINAFGGFHITGSNL